jgi:hypothetical protein
MNYYFIIHQQLACYSSTHYMRLRILELYLV